MRAVQMFALLGLGSGQRVCVTSINADKELSVRKGNAAANYLRSHGYDVEEFAVSSRARPAEVLAVEVADRKISTLVMGAYGHRGFREFIFGSTTSRLAEDPPCPLFIYH